MHARNACRLSLILVALLFLSLARAFAGEQTVSPEQTAGESRSPQLEMKSSQDRFTISGWLEAGFTGNFASPQDHQNFGCLLDDRSNQVLLNQFVISAERVLDPKASDHFDWGFKVQLLYGSDARYLHSLGLLDLVTDATVQPDIPEAWLLMHFPITGTTGGLDLKLGTYVNCFGADMSDPRMNVFYSRTYIFNFGCPFNGTGTLVTLHAAPWLDLYASIDRGVNVSLEDNNNSVAFYGGFVGNLYDGKVAYAALTHIGPEDPHNNHDYRYLSDFTVTWKATNRLTSITDLNYVYEQSVHAEGYGVAQYFTYTLTDWLTAGIRGEVWRDADGFFVAQFASNNDFVHFERGDTIFDPRTVGGGRTTYGALTAGVTIKPAVPKPLTGLMIRPEVRYDRSLNNTHPFNDSSDRDMVTAGFDVIFTF